MSKDQLIREALQNEPGLVTIRGYFTTDVAGDINKTSFKGGLVVSPVAHTAKGRYTITLADRYSTLMGVECGMNKASASGVATAEVRAETVKTTKLIEIGFYNTESPMALVDPVSATVYVTIHLDDDPTA